MGKAQYFLTLLAAVLALGDMRACADEASDIEKWIEQLSNEDFDTREKATIELGKRAEKIWERLEKLSKGDNTDVRTLARRAMGEAGKRALKKVIDEQTAEIAAQLKKIQDAPDAVKPFYAAIHVAEEAERDAIEKRIIDTNDDTKAGEAKATKAKEEAVSRWRKAREDVAEKQKNWEKELRTRELRLDQLKTLQESNEIFLPSEIGDWKPEKLPFDKKLKCLVTFEFVDATLNDVAKYFKKSCGLKVEIDSSVKDAPMITLRVSSMCADLSIEWITKLADVEYTVDGEGKRVIIHKPK